MAESKIDTIELNDEKLEALAAEYEEAKRIKDEADGRMTALLHDIEEYTGINKDTDYEGKKRLLSGKMQITVEYKLTRSVQKDKALALCSEKGLNPLDVFNVKLDYPTKGLLEKMPGVGRDIVYEATTIKRAKSALDIKEITK